MPQLLRLLYTCHLCHLSACTRTPLAGSAKFVMHRLEVLDSKGLLGPGPGIRAGVCVCAGVRACMHAPGPCSPRRPPRARRRTAVPCVALNLTVHPVLQA